MYKAYHILYIVHTYTVSDTYFFFLDSLFVDACRHMKIDLYVLEKVFITEYIIMLMLEYI